MPLSFNPPPIDQQLRQTIRKMGDFLTDNPSDADYYNMLYVEIDKLSIRAKLEGWFGYEHRNPHKTLTDFLNSGGIHELVIKYYSIPTLGKKLVKQTKAEKTINGGKKFVDWITNQISKFKPDIRLK